MTPSSSVVTIAAIGMAALLFPHPAAAQSAPALFTSGASATLSIGHERVYLREGLEVDGSESGERLVSTGGNVQVEVSYGFGNRVSVFVRASGAAVNADGFSSANSGNLDIGARFFVLPTSRSTRPYAMAALNTRAFVVEDDDFEPDATRRFEFTGRGATLGAGLQNRIQRSLALDVSVARTLGSLGTLRTTVDRDDDEEDPVSTAVDRRARSTRVSVGLVWYFLR